MDMLAGAEHTVAGVYVVVVAATSAHSTPRPGPDESARRHRSAAPVGSPLCHVTRYWPFTAVRAMWMAVGSHSIRAKVIGLHAWEARGGRGWGDGGVTHSLMRRVLRVPRLSLPPAIQNTTDARARVCVCVCVCVCGGGRKWEKGATVQQRAAAPRCAVHSH